MLLRDCQKSGARIFSFLIRYLDLNYKNGVSSLFGSKGAEGQSKESVPMKPEKSDLDDPRTEESKASNPSERRATIRSSRYGINFRRLYYRFEV
jgi:hypothetical protein